MKNLKLNYFTLFFITSIIFTSCSTNDDETLEEINESSLIVEDSIRNIEVNFYDNDGPHYHDFITTNSSERTSSFTETFESGSKTSYAENDVNLSSGNWILSDALIGTSTSDRKFGSRSVRIRNTGSALMTFNMDNGASTVSVRHAKFGNDNTSTWRLIASFDNGASWQFVGSTTVTTNSTAINTVSFNVNETRSVRYGIYKTSGGSNRINIDNIEINILSTNTGNGIATRDSNITFGNPSNANTSSTNYLLSRSDYTLSYNNNKGTANWVSWHLSTAWTGNADRCDCFSRDTTLPSNFFRATTSDYTNSGFDRGHLCPSADRNESDDSNRNTFFMTNIAPQAADNNQRSWARFEDFLREQIQEGNEVHIIAGVAGSGGTGRNGFASTIDGGNITVPDSFWKVALILPNGTNDINRVTTSSRVIAVNIPNDQGISTDWTDFRTTVNEIESLTGYDILENINNSVESVIEARVDNGPV